MMDVEGRPRVVHPVSSYIDFSKDKQGFTQVIIIPIFSTTIIKIPILTTNLINVFSLQASLRLPSWVKVDPLPPTPESELLPAGSPIPSTLLTHSTSAQSSPRLIIQLQVWTGAIVGPRMGALHQTHRQQVSQITNPVIFQNCFCFFSWESSDRHRAILSLGVPIKSTCGSFYRQLFPLILTPPVLMFSLWAPIWKHVEWYRVASMGDFKYHLHWKSTPVHTVQYIPKITATADIDISRKSCSMAHSLGRVMTS